jgi:carbamoyl-phosphate synthase small subunit
MKLTLESGEVFHGVPFGRRLLPGEIVVAELVFNTGQSGYEEVLTDPSYFRQLVLMTFPLIGNTGINRHDAEHGRAFLSGLLVREYEPEPSHHRAVSSLPDYLCEQGVPGLAGIDTRALTRTLRTHGTLTAALAEKRTEHSLIMAALSRPLPTDHVARVSTRQPEDHAGQGPLIAVIDYGCKRGIVRALLSRGCAVRVFPHDASAVEILAAQPAGVVLSNGPGDPRELPQALPVIRALQERLPLLGICLGHQLFALANGADTAKLHHGHRGCNRAVYDEARKKSAVAAHNHGYAVTAPSIAGTELCVTYRDLNDGCVEGLRHTRLPAFSVQFHPEAGPGPEDPGFLFNEFLVEVAGGRAAAEAPCR